ncbi:glycosyltransferase [Prodigiosinella aquatilis]|nr:glycosyltransferase [Prodigiosinella sp. LS101]WJV52151.1 glycosyltransferase [Prodigiosinella sp. LS101]WJV56509.1 glycosyltransferase [Pectobacteriaceae bacterium C111]
MSKKNKYPYYITSPDYRESSSGIRVLHRLCHLINEQGGEAYMVGCNVVNPDWNAPLLSVDDSQRHQSNGGVFIAIYPEIISGNPIDAPVCVRFMLNKEALLNGNMLEEGEDDLFFYFRKELADNEANVNLLRLDFYDFNLFCDDNKEKDLDLLYLNRVSPDSVDFLTLPEGIRILSISDPLPLKELAQVLKRGRALYTYEASSTCVLATLCGCPVISRVAPGYEKYAITQETMSDIGNVGVAWSNDPAELESVKSNLYKVKEHYERLENIFFQQLNVFFELTQKKAEQYTRTKAVCDLNGWLSTRMVSSGQKLLIQKAFDEHHMMPKFCIAILNIGGDKDDIYSTIDTLAVARQEYPYIECVVLTADHIELYESVTDWVSLLIAEQPHTLLNQVIEQYDFDWLQCVYSGTYFTLNGLLIAGLNLVKNESCYAVYSDILVCDSEDNITAEFFPDFNLDLLLSLPQRMAKDWLFHRQALIDIDGFDLDFIVSFEFDAIIRLIESKDISGIGHLSEPILIEAHRINNSHEENISIIMRHLQNRGYSGSQVIPHSVGGYRLVYGHQQASPLVSIIVIAQGSLSSLQRCVTSLLEKTQYAKYELILVKGQTCNSEIHTWLSAVAEMDSSRIRVLSYPHLSAIPALMNHAIEEVSGEFVLLLDINALLVQVDWLDNLLNQGLRPEVGCVGAKLINLDRTIGSAGVILGLNGISDSPFMGEIFDNAGYMQRLNADQNYCVLSGDCLLVKKSVYTHVGGMDENIQISSLRDIDFGLKVRESGYMSVWTPYAVIAQDNTGRASSSYEALSEYEVDVYRRWLPLIANDPSYNKNLSLKGKGYEPEWNSALTWQPLSWRPVPMIMAWSGEDKRSASSRIIHPLEKMKSEGFLDGIVIQKGLTIPEFYRFNPDVLVVQGCHLAEYHRWLDQIKTLNPIFTVCDIDEHFLSAGLIKKNGHGKSKHLIAQFDFIDRVVTTSETLAELYSKDHRDICILPSFLNSEWKALQQECQPSEKVRIGCVTHDLSPGDIILLATIIRELSEKVEWIFLGKYPERLKPYITEFHRYSGNVDYPKVLASLNLDLAIAPLEDTLFNRCRNNLRLLEFGACGIPVICSDIESYKDNLPVTRVKNRYKDWLSAIQMHLHDRNAMNAKGKELRHHVFSNWMLENDNIKLYLRSWLPKKS